MRKLLILVLFAAMPLSSVLAKEGLLNSSFEEVASILGKPYGHDNGNDDAGNVIETHEHKGDFKEF